MNIKEIQQLSKQAFPFALGYWQGRACGQFENGTFENMTDIEQHLFKIGYDAGVADYSELDTNYNSMEKD